MKIALVRDGVVINVCVWDGATEFPTPGISKIAIEDTSPICRGFTYSDGAFTPYLGWGSSETVDEPPVLEEPEAPKSLWARMFGS